jgi:NAD(P)-dependent dehydrogenase (short-subunit alcohol dehydrogenase family)
MHSKLLIFCQFSGPDIVSWKDGRDEKYLPTPIFFPLGLPGEPGASHKNLGWARRKIVLTKDFVLLKRKSDIHIVRPNPHRLGRLAAPDDLIGTAVFLATPASDFVTGQALFVDGDWVAAG